MKAVLISIQPKWCEMIATGKKTIEVRKRCPRLETPFKCYIYCGKDEREYVFFTEEVFEGKNVKFAIPYKGNGKVIGEFICDRIDEYICGIPPFYELSDGYNVVATELEKMYLGYRDLKEYGKGKSLYGWYISQLKIYDKPKYLSEFYKLVKYDNVCGAKVVHCGHYQGIEAVDFCEYNEGACSLKECEELRNLYQIKRPPQSWCYVEVQGNEIV